VFMRSNDCWLGLPYDVLSFTTVQRVVASALGVQPGEYCHVADNLHLYEKDHEAARRVLEERGVPPGQVFVPWFERLFYGLDASQITRVFDRCLRGGEAPMGVPLDSIVRAGPVALFAKARTAGPDDPLPILRRIRAATRGEASAPSETDLG
jgi:hypothetical protein